MDLRSCRDLISKPFLLWLDWNPEYLPISDSCQHTRYRHGCGWRMACVKIVWMKWKTSHFQFCCDCAIVYEEIMAATVGNQLSSTWTETMHTAESCMQPVDVGFLVVDRLSSRFRVYGSEHWGVRIWAARSIEQHDIYRHPDFWRKQVLFRYQPQEAPANIGRSRAISRGIKDIDISLYRGQDTDKYR